MRMTDIIEHKKQGLKLTGEEIEFFVKGYTKGDIPDYQASALAMAIYFNKMTNEETATLTLEMAKSGDMLDLSEFKNLTVDKHSSGGVGDKTTLVVAPIAAAAGCTVAKMSGRGLGFTGGTIDKLEAIPGFCTAMSPESFKNQARDIGLVVAGQTGNMAPCDKKLYALRDVTATVDCMPLIASSIMSKKLAAGAKNIVLDVKCGEGAFMKDIQSAALLASEMVNIGRHCQRNVRALITDMSCPLGYAVGNSLEVAEAIKILKGENIPRLTKLCIALAANMISLTKQVDLKEAENEAKEMIKSGKALEKLKEMVKAQGGDVSYIDDENKFGFDEYKTEIKAEKQGYISNIDAQKIGNICVILGAGRNVKTDSIDSKAGILLSCQKGDYINSGDTVMTLYSNDENKLKQAKELALNSFEISNKKPACNDIILKQL